MANNIGEGMRRLCSRELQTLVLQIKDGTFEYEDKPKRPIYWRSYNEAQLNELADMLIMIRDIVDIAAERIASREKPHKYRGPGRRRIPAVYIVKILLLQGYFGASDRVAGGYLKVFDTKLGIPQTFSYKTIERGYDPERTKALLDEVFKLMNEWSNFNEDTASIDGTGDPTTNKVNYESKRSQQRKDSEKKKSTKEVNAEWPGKKRDFEYDVLGVGRHTKIIGAFSISDDHKIGELTQAYSILDPLFTNIPNLGIMLGDSLYANRPFCEKIYEHDAALYSLPKSNSTLSNKGYKDWSRMVYEFILDPIGFQTTFHGRSISETVNSMMKRREPMPIRRRITERKNTAEVLKINIHNLRQSCYLTYLAPLLTKIPLHR